MSYKSRYARTYGTREEQIQRARKKGYKVVKAVGCSAIAAVQLGPKFSYKVWQGKADKPCANFIARDASDVERGVAYYFNCQRRREAVRAKERAERKGVKAADFWEVGDVMGYSWGYDQTNVDWYQVVEVLKSSIRIRKIRKNSSDFGGPSGGKCQPRRFDFCGEPELKKVQKNGYISFPHGCGSKWDGRPVYCSSYH